MSRLDAMAAKQISAMVFLDNVRGGLTHSRGQNEVCEPGRRLRLVEQANRFGAPGQGRDG